MVSLLLLFCSLGADETIKIGYSESIPMIYRENDSLKGFDIDLLDIICKENKWKPEFVSIAERGKRCENLQKGMVDVIAGGFSITDDREKIIDFSTPYFNSGLMFATKYKDCSSIWATLYNNKDIWYSVGILIFTIVFFAHMVWMFEKDSALVPSAGEINNKYFPGIFEAMWYVWITMATIGYGDYVAKRWLGRLMVFIVTIIGLGIAANVVATVGTFKLQRKLCNINSIVELENKNIGYPEGTTSEDASKIISASFTPFSSMTSMIESLNNGTIDAMVYDVPFIMKVAKDNPKKITTIKSVVMKQDYGFGIKQGSPLREKLNLSVLKLQRTGELDRIYTKWFGE